MWVFLVEPTAAGGEVGNVAPGRYKAEPSSNWGGER